MNSSTVLWHNQQIAILLIIVAAAVLLVAFFWRSAQKSDVENSAEEILKRRYAKGEIDSETYTRVLAELRK